MIKFVIENPWVIFIVLIWTLPWKGAALWRAAKNDQIAWFLALLVLNTFAILEIIYLLFFNKKKIEEPEQEFPSRNQYRRTPGAGRMV